MSLHWIDYAIMLIYVGFVVGIGFALKRYMRSSADFFLSGRSIPAWVCGLAFLSANLGALELVGMAASGAKYGIATCHFYWLGAIPAMVFLAVFMMPFYYGSKARSVPEYLKLRFDERTRAFNSCTFAVMTVFASGISLNLLAQLLNSLTGINYTLALLLSSVVVLLYVFKGGLTSAMYTEVLQFFMIVLGFAPVVWLGMRDMGGWNALKDALRGVAQNPASVGVNTHAFPPDAWTSAWTPIIAGPAQNPLGVDVFAMVFGLGFVMSFGYWCTNFLVIQRAMAAKDMSAARRTPLIAALPKMLFPALVILPGMLAVGLAFTGKDGYKLPTTQLDSGEVAKAYADLNAGTNPSTAPASESLADVLSRAQNAINAAPDRVAMVKRDVSAHLDETNLPTLVSNMLLKPISLEQFQTQLQKLVTDVDYNGIILSLLKKYCPPGMMGLALTALLASFMSGMAGNVTAFNTVWTYDLYQAYLAPNKPDAHYVWMGKVVTVVGIALSIACAFVAREFPNAMDMVQLVFGFVNAPLFATFLLGMFWARTTSHGAFFGLAGGTLTSCLFHLLTVSSGNAAGWIKGAALGTAYVFPSDMARNFWLAIGAFTSCFVLTVVISLATKRTKSNEELKGLVYSLTARVHEPNQAWYASPGFLGTVLLFFCLLLNIYFW